MKPCKNKHQTIEKICYCGAYFKSNRRRARYCSIKCRNNFRNRKKHPILSKQCRCGKKFHGFSKQKYCSYKCGHRFRQLDWCRKNPEKSNAIYRKSYYANKEKHRTATKNWVEKNKDRNKATVHRYYLSIRWSNKFQAKKIEGNILRRWLGTAKVTKNDKIAFACYQLGKRIWEGKIVHSDAANKAELVRQGKTYEAYR